MYPPVQYHGLGFPCIAVQNRLHEHLANKTVYFLPGLIVLLEKARTKLIHYDDRIEYPFDQIRTPVVLQTPARRTMPQGWRELPQKEFLYDLDEVFDRSRYRNADHYKKRVKYPLNLMNRYQYRTVEITRDNLPLVKEIHDDWVRYKLASGKVYAMMFSKTRYYNLIEHYLSHHATYFPAHLTIGLIEDRPFCVDANYFFKGMGYGMCGFSLFFKFDQYPSRLTEGRNLIEFQQLRDRGIKWYTTGIAESTDLKTYKREFPHRIATYYHYLFG